MWVVANFIEENNVEVVPKCWISGDECFWPTISRDKLKKYIEKATEPDGTEIWKKYKARIIGQKIYDDLQKARQKSNLALIRSDIETDVEEKKRSRFQNKKYIDDDSRDSSSNTSEASHERRLQKEETPKKVKKSLWPSKKKGTKVVSSPFRVPGDLPDFSLLRRSPRKLDKTPVLQTPEITQSRFKSSTPQPSTSWATQATGSNSGNFEEVCIRNQNITKNFLRQILSELAAVKDKLEELQQQPRVTAGTVEEESDFLNILPLKTVEDLEALEEDLQDKTKETEVANFLGRLGGSNMADACRRALHSSLLDEVACHFSWVGQKGKKMFSGLKLKTAIFRAVLKQFPDAKEKEIEGVVKDWLRPSKNRLLSKEKSRKRVHDGDEDNAQ